MKSKRIMLHVDGMTCGACESRITKTLRALSGVLSAEARVQSGQVIVEYDEDQIDLSRIENAIENIGYPIRRKNKAATAIALGIGLLLVAAYLIASVSGVFSTIPQITANVGYAMLFVIGLLTSIHCVAMCGGIALSQSVGMQGPEAAANSVSMGERFRRLRPGLFYNLGRIVSYTSIGAVVGALGATFNFSSASKGIIAALAGAFMILLGLKMLGVVRGFPQIGKVVPAPLRKAAGAISRRLRRGGPFAVGILNGLMPCGPLQTMQLYALGTGSVLAGAISMFVFSLGTVPLMLLFGLTATLLPRKFVPIMVKASAVLVMFLGAVTFARAATLAGISLPAITVSSPAVLEPTGNVARARLIKADVSDGKQTVLTEFRNGQYVPFAAQSGLPLTWTIRISAEDLNGCNNEIVIPAYDVRKKLVPGDNVIEFTPTKAGRVAYSCWMGMIRSSITVTDALGNEPSATLPEEPLALPGGSGCCALPQ
ncbi:sulfite exporter TauE/SafE family protein [Treponema zuelzerae]|uniref:Sulfite exporter TauE/SafE family protein n=1 Tax=Teretinema zuelzerae TaxID=156 RepID=A0AAE3EJZ7_9SPIR|nr:sulfite exporter TauE/SafE family protein [Teretinema zuelzerae]MCD1655188.1 sulfite exporter TauE/SafE family protein [Teretinema zuelzerae]